MPLPLEGVPVFLLDAGIAGIYAGRLLARFGATVTVIEPPSGDPIRRLSPFPHDRPGLETGGWWQFLAAGLNSITLDLANRTAQHILLRLPIDLALTSPDLVPLVADRSVVAVSPFGSQIPLAVSPATDLILAAAGGLMASTGEADREPLAPPGPAVQVAAGLFAAIAALYLLNTQDRLRGDLSLMETVVATGIYETTSFSYRGAVRTRSGPKYSPALVLNTTLQCADGYVGLHLNTQPQWRALCDFMDRPDLADDPRFRTAALRAANWQDLDAIVLPWAAALPAAHLYHEGQRRRIPFSLIPGPAEVLASTQLNARGFFETVAHPVAGTLQMPGAPFRIGEDRGRTARAPLLGEHTAGVLASAGINPVDLPRLRASGAL